MSDEVQAEEVEQPKTAAEQARDADLVKLEGYAGKVKGDLAQRKAAAEAARLQAEATLKGLEEQEAALDEQVAEQKAAIEAAEYPEAPAEPSPWSLPGPSVPQKAEEPAAPVA